MVPPEEAMYHGPGTSVLTPETGRLWKTMYIIHDYDISRLINDK